MLPNFLYDTYKQYKADTDKIATWLAEAAMKCGWAEANTGNGASSIQSGKPPKLKGRARKLAREAAAAGKATPSPSKNAPASVPVYKVRVKDFVPMAQMIANAGESSVRIPAVVIKVIKRCITTRTGTSDWFEKNEDEQTEEKGRNHMFFVKVLSDTLEVLEAKYVSQSPPPQPSVLEGRGAAATAEATKNTFDGLEVEELDEDAFNALPSVVSSRPNPIKYEIEKSDDGEEWFFALHCLFDDLHEIQELIREMWSDYLEGKLDISTASVVTNMAVALVKRAEQDFQHEMKPPDGYTQFKDGELTDIYYVDNCLRYDLKPRRTPGTMVDAERYEYVEDAFLLPSRCLISINEHVKSLNGKSFPGTRPAYLGTYDPALHRAAMSNEEKMHSDTALLMDFIVTFGPYVAAGNNTPMDDELIKGLRHMCETGKIPLWLVFAAQLYLDVHGILTTESNRPFEELNAFAREARKTLRGHVKFFEKHGLVGYREEESEEWVLISLAEIETWVLKDQMKQVAEDQMGSSSQSGKKNRIWQDNEFLLMHPVLNGMWKYCFHLQMQSRGIRLVNDTQIISAAHLYNALRQCGYLPTDCYWEDLEYLLDIHGEKDTFAGERPTTIEDCVKRLAIAQGVSPKTFAAHRRGGTHRVIYSKSGGKFLKPTTPMAQVLYPFFMQGEDFALSMDMVEKVLDERVEQIEKLRRHFQRNPKKAAMLREFLGDGDGEVRNEEPNEETRKAAREHEPEAETKVEAEQEQGQGHESVHEHEFEPNLQNITRWKTHHQISIPAFLSEFASALSAEHLDLEFDYFAFHRSAWSLLEDIQAAVLPLIQPYLGDMKYSMAQSEDGTTLCPGLIMHLACDPRKSNMAILKEGDVIDDVGLRAAAEVMVRFIEREGDAYAKVQRRRLAMRGMGWERSADPVSRAAGAYREGEVMSEDVREHMEGYRSKEMFGIRAGGEEVEDSVILKKLRDLQM